MGFVFAMTLPGLVLLLLAVAAVDQLLLRTRGRGIVPRRDNTPVSSTGFDLLHAALSPGKADELAQRQTEEFVRDEDDDGAPRTARSTSTPASPGSGCRAPASPVAPTRSARVRG